MFRTIFVVLLFFISFLSALERYEVQLVGPLPRDLIPLLQSASRLVTLRGSPPSSLAALKRRANADIDNLIKVLHSRAYYNATVTVKIDETKNPVQVSILIEPGPVYPLKSFEILGNLCLPVPLKAIGVCLGEPALPKTIIEAERSLLCLLEEEGYPLGSIENREVLVDQTNHSVSVILKVAQGPAAYFGPTKICGNKEVKTAFFSKKIAWKEGERYDPAKVQETQEAIEASGLFKSIDISHEEAPSENCRLPMFIEVKEGKFRSIGWGLAYNTQRGPGITAEWEHRNIRHLGEKLTARTILWYDLQELTLLYLIPDFYIPRQDLLCLTEARREKTKGFREEYVSVSAVIEKQLNPETRLSYGTMLKRLHSKDSEQDRNFNLLKVPFQLRWNGSNSLLDPTSGFAVHLRVIPSLNLFPSFFTYTISTITLSTYLPLCKSHRVVLAMKGTFGSILGARKNEIPAAEKFYEGSETNLRGYRYLTVSPLNEHHDPLGGRSMILGSFELRSRFSETIGGVAFFDIGNVYAPPLPRFRERLLKAVGIGLRYHTPVGPIRIDIAFPLNRRRHLDRFFQIYLSVGQAF